MTDIVEDDVPQRGAKNRALETNIRKLEFLRTNTLNNNSSRTRLQISFQEIKVLWSHADCLQFCQQIICKYSSKCAADVPEINRYFVTSAYCKYPSHYQRRHKISSTQAWGESPLVWPEFATMQVSDQIPAYYSLRKFGTDIREMDASIVSRREGRILFVQWTNIVETPNFRPARFT